VIPGIGIGIGFSQGNPNERLVRGISGRVIWLRADRGITLSSGEVASWTDTSVAGGLTATTDAGSGGITVVGGGAGGRPYLSVGQSGWDYMAFASGAVQALLSTNTAEGFFVFRRDSDPASTGQGGLHTMIGQLNGIHVPYTNSTIYDTFYTNTRKEFAVTAGSTAIDACCYNPRSTAGEWTARLNGAQVHTTATNSVSRSATNGLLGLATSTDIYLQGRFYEFLLYNKILSTTERSQVESYIRRRYATSW
jgi:hypothetical protein